MYSDSIISRHMPNEALSLGCLEDCARRAKMSGRIVLRYTPGKAENDARNELMKGVESWAIHPYQITDPYCINLHHVLYSVSLMCSKVGINFYGVCLRGKYDFDEEIDPGFKVLLEGYSDDVVAVEPTSENFFIALTRLKEWGAIRTAEFLAEALLRKGFKVGGWQEGMLLPGKS